MRQHNRSDEADKFVLFPSRFPLNSAFFPILITIMHCRHRNKEIVSVSVKVINNYASKIMTNESKIHIDQIKSIKDMALPVVPMVPMDMPVHQ